MSNFLIMAAVTATYQPQNGQKFRCSIDIPGWNTPAGGQIMFQVVVPQGYAQPVFSIVQDKKGKDDTWYQNISNGVIIPVGDHPGANSVYIGTTSTLPLGSNGATEYAVIIWISYP